MAEKRMFAKTIVLSDAFLDMPMSARCLYFTLGMLADDEGFVSAPKSIMRQCGASQDDLSILLAKRYILAFESGVIVIKHWRINNYLRSDRYTPTTYLEERSMLKLDGKGAYIEADKWIPGPDEDVPELPEPEKPKKTGATEEPKGEPIVTILLNDGSEYPVYQDYVDQMQSLYPAVDVVQELRNMSAWSINNPEKRKTSRGITRFIGNWLSREQDKGGVKKGEKTGNPFRRVGAEDW